MVSMSTARVDLDEAAEKVKAAVLAEIPTATVSITTVGDAKQPTYREAMGQEFARRFSSSTEIAFVVRADLATPRPLQVQVRYALVGRGAGALSVLYLARLSVTTPGRAVVKRKGSWPLAKSTFDGDAPVRDALAGAAGLGKGIANFLVPAVAFGNVVFRFEPYVELVPEDDGALLAAFSAPTGRVHQRLALRSLLEIAEATERAIAAVPGSAPGANPSAPIAREAAI